MPGDKAFYYSNEDGYLQGAVLTHVDDVILAGNIDLLKKLEENSRNIHSIKIERNKFRFIG